MYACRCGLCIFMGKTDPSAERHVQQSMILVPMPSAGLNIVRPLTVFGYDDAPHGHAEVEFKGVRVPADNLLVGEGKGFEIAQGRLGPGRIHHCMRLIGVAERALSLLCTRANERVAFGKPLSTQGTVRADIAKARLMIDQCRLLCLQAAREIDAGGVKAARHNIALIKVAAPQMAAWVVDRALQVHGAAGFCDDYPLAFLYAQSRALSMADGPDEVCARLCVPMPLSRLFLCSRVHRGALLVCQIVRRGPPRGRVISVLLGLQNACERERVCVCVLVVLQGASRLCNNFCC